MLSLSRSIAFTCALLSTCVTPAAAQVLRHPPSATLEPAPRQTLVLSGEPAVDSNSPVVWDAVEGASTLFVMTSFAGAARLSSGQRLGAVVIGDAAQWDVWPAGGAWMEAILKAEDGTWYGYYHNEVATGCRDDARVQPRIGAARSTDQGRTWTNLGIILESTPAACDTTNQYFTGGVGDFSVMRSPDGADVYVVYSQYTPDVGAQGVAMARLPWADRDAPAGRLSVWDGRVWQPVESRWDDEGEWAGFDYPTGASLFPSADSLHDGNTASVFWGPSVHWNTHLRQYVMLLNRAQSPGFGQEGIYVAFSPSLTDPDKWTAPTRILSGGEWYPQVVGLEPGVGTDKDAGEVVRFFMAGVSDFLLTFSND